MNDEKRPAPSLVRRAGLERELGGQEAVDALGDSLEAVARQHGMSADGLRELLLRDSTARIGRTGRIFYRDPAAPVPGVGRDDAARPQPEATESQPDATTQAAQPDEA